MLKYCCINYEKHFFLLENIINVLVGSFGFIGIPYMLCVCGHYKYVYSYSGGIDYRRRH